MTIDVLRGARLPAETDPHERTLMAWPTEVRRDQLWHDTLDRARDDYAHVARQIARFEPVAMVANPSEADVARTLCGDAVEIIELPIDDAWLRDSGPVIVRSDDGVRVAVHFRFNGWGGKFTPVDRDEAVGALLATKLGLPCVEAPFVLEGGSIVADGTGAVVTTERCLLNDNRNSGWDTERVEGALRAYLGSERVVWLADGIVEDDGTDGHVDNVVAFAAPGRVLLQGCADPSNPNHAVARDNRARLERAGFEVVEIPVLPYAEVDGARHPVPYVNLYPVNGGVLIFGHRPERRFQVFVGDAVLLAQFGGSPDEQAARWRVDVDGEGDPRVAVQRRDLVRAGNGEGEELALTQKIAERDGSRASVGRGIGDLHDRLPLDEVESHRVGQDLDDTCGVHVVPPGP
jgi:agmatine deiminase